MKTNVKSLLQNQQQLSFEDYCSLECASGNFIRISAGGMQGTGKTRTLIDMLVGMIEMKFIQPTKECPILIIDNEKGIRFHMDRLQKYVNAKQIRFKETTSLADVILAINYLKNKNICCAFTDSLSKVWYRFVKDYKNQNRKEYMSPADWGIVKTAWQEEFSDFLTENEVNFMFTGRGGFEYESERDEDTGKLQFFKGDAKMRVAGETQHECDLNLWMVSVQKHDGKLFQIERHCTIIKDRFGIIDGKDFINPLFASFRPVFEKMMKQATGKAAKETDSSLLSPELRSPWQERQKNKQAELEKIDNLFDLYGFGRSTDAIQLKTAIIKKIFGTLSRIEIESFEHNILISCRENLETLLKDLQNKKEGKSPLDIIQDYIIVIKKPEPEKQEKPEKPTKSKAA